MSIADEVLRIKNNISNAYIEAEKKGATMPTVRNSENLSSTISGIVGDGGGEYDIIQTIIGDECELHITDSRTGVDRSGKYVCKVVDYDGTILKQEEHYAGDVFTLPEFPTHDRLVAQEWACAVPITNNQIEVTDSDILVGIVYTTKSGLSEFDYVLNPLTGLTATLNMAGTKDWGDGTVNTEYTHTYANYGKYTVTCDGSQAVSVYADDEEPLVDTYSSGYSCVGIRLGNRVVKFGDVYYVVNVAHCTIPNTVTSLGGDTGVVTNCPSVQTLVIPSSVVNISGGMSGAKNIILSYGVQGFSSIDHVGDLILPASLTTIGTLTCNSTHIPDSVTSINKLSVNDEYLTLPSNLSSLNEISGTQIKYLELPNSLSGMSPIITCGNVEQVVLSDNIITVRVQTFRKCYKLSKIVYPKNVEEVITTFPTNNVSVTNDFSKCVSVPILSGELFINPHSIAMVPDELYDQWIANDGWSAYASQIYKASEVTL